MIKKLTRTLFAAIVCIFLFSAFNTKHKVKIFMIGDSTMANKDISGGKLERGWGMMLKNFFSEDVIVDNYAVNGRSSKSFITEGRWKKVLDQIKPGDYVFIQFGHNDEKKDTARHTVPGSTFDENLRKFVQETRQKGGIPVLFNSVVRRTFVNNKTAIEDDDKRDNSSKDLVEGNVLIDTHGDYIVSPKRVAEEMNVPFIDANKITHDLEQSLGPEDSKKLHMWYKPGEVASLPEGRQDNTHYNIYGARLVAGLLAKAVTEKVPALKDCLRYYDFVVANDGSGTHFNVQDAVDVAPKGKPTTILICDGEWKKPDVLSDKKITFVLRNGAHWSK